MKMLLSIDCPPEPFNSLVRSAEIGDVIGRILKDIKPDIAYFTEQNGHRGGIFVVDVKNPSDVPRLAEPFFLTLNANCSFRILMTPEELGKAGLDKLGRKWN